MRYWIVLILVNFLCMAGGADVQSKLSTRWEELTAGDFKEAIAKAQGTCLLPFGILEKHGPHLPLGTDLLNVRYVAEHAAQEDGRRAQGRLSTVSNSLVVLKRHSAQICELARRPCQPRFPNISLAI